MEQDLAQDAISAALTGEWEKALHINKEILTTSPEDTDALNRAARAHAELGNVQKARETVQTVLKIDPFNSIAKKALDRWKGLKNGDTVSSGTTSSQVFLEEPGKTKIISLLHLGAPDALAELDSGDEMKFNCHSHRVSVMSLSGKYAGRLPDDLSARIRKLDKLGYEYRTFIKSVDKTEVKVFIRETKRPAKLTDIPSFPTEKINYISYTPPELVREEDESSGNEDTASGE
jgi:tetratricopeptide (TPR) repeat protein